MYKYCLRLLLGGSVFVVATACSSGGSGGSSQEITLENVCDIMPERYCAQDEPCCKKAGYGFDQAGCEASYRMICADGVAAVSAHSAKFNPDNLNKCVAAYQPFEDKCELTAAEFATANVKSNVCLHLFEGTRAQGDPCVSNAECAPLAADKGFAYCDGATCTTIAPGFAEGEPCGPGSCASGLDCNGTKCAPAAEPAYAVNPLNCASSGNPAGAP
jgi:hypothetical protein